MNWAATSRLVANPGWFRHIHATVSSPAAAAAAAAANRPGEAATAATAATAAGTGERALSGLDCRCPPAPRRAE